MMDREMNAPKVVVVMGSEPIPDWTPTDIQAWYMRQPDESRLATAYAAVSNQFWWVEDDEYDYEAGTPEYNKAREIADAWGRLMKSLKRDIFKILEGEGVVIPETRQITVLSPFMERNGYYDGDGWWLPKPKDSGATTDFRIR